LIAAGEAVFRGLKAPAFGGCEPFGAKKPPAVKCFKLQLALTNLTLPFFFKDNGLSPRRVFEMTLHFYHPI
jgi:hypothetical protein